MNDRRPEDRGSMSVDVLHYSGGWQSNALLWMLIRRELKAPRYSTNSKLFAVVQADTGDEHEQTYQNIARMKAAAAEAGITYLTAEGPKIPSDFSEESTAKRIETIPYWTKDAEGKIGQLMHCCTRHYNPAYAASGYEVA